MTDKQIIIDVCPYQGECSVSGCKRNDDGCFVRQLFEERYRAENQIVELNKKVEAKEQECERLKEEVQQALKKNAENYNNSCSLQKEVNQLKEELSQKYVKDDIKTYCPFFFRDTATCLGRDLNEIGQLNFCRKYHNCWIKKIAKENSKLKEQLEAYKMEAEEGKEINAELKADNKHLNGLLNQALKELEQSREAIEKIKDIAQDFGFNGIYEDCFTGIQKIIQICDEVNE